MTYQYRHDVGPTDPSSSGGSLFSLQPLRLEGPLRLASASTMVFGMTLLTLAALQLGLNRMSHPTLNSIASSLPGLVTLNSGWTPFAPKPMPDPTPLQVPKVALLQTKFEKSNDALTD